MGEHWQTSSYSTGTNPNCVECRTAESRILIRDTQHRHLGHISVPTREWAALLGALRADDL